MPSSAYLAKLHKQLTTACEQRDMDAVRAALREILFCGRIYDCKVVLALMIKYALNTELMQLFFDVGLRADSNNGAHSPFFIAIQDGTVEDVMFYITNGANVNLVLLGLCPVYHALRTKTDPIPKLRELLLAHCRSINGLNPYIVLVSGLNERDHVLQWLINNQTASELQLLVQGASLDRILRYIHFSYHRPVFAEIMTALPKATKEASKVLQDTLLPWSPATRYTFNGAFCDFADKLVAMQFLPADVTDVVISFFDRFER